jgi:phosphate transport system permease protein
VSDAYRTRLIEPETSLLKKASAVVVGLGFLTFLFAWLTLFEVVSLETRLFGVGLFDLLGLDLLVMGGAVLAFGVGSRAGLIQSSPTDTAGLLAGIAFGLLGLAVGGLVASQTFGFGPAGWLPIALVTGTGMAAVTVLPREDVGSTVPAGVLAVAAGVVLLAGVIGTEWTWSPSGFEATFTARIAVPVLAVFCSLLVAWAGAKAHAGFGHRGRQRGAYFLIGVNAVAMLAVLFLLLGFVVSRGLPKATEGIEVGLGVGPTVAFELRLPFDWPFVMNVSQGIYVDVPGVLPAIMGTAWLIIGAMLFAVPLGVGAAVFLTEYADQGRFTSVVEVTTNGLRSTPSIVFGLFGLAFLVPRFGNTNSLFVGMVVLGFMLLPLVLITSREALKSVPDEYRDASAALGVSQWETIKSVVLPAALPGVITGIILGVGRIAGETAPILLVTAGAPFPSATPGVLGGFEFAMTPPFVTNDALLTSASALPYQLFATITAGVGAGDAQAFGWGTALVLLLVVLSFYAIGIGLRTYFRRKLHQ